MKHFNFSNAEYRNREQWHWEVLKSEWIRDISSEVYEQKIWIGPKGSKPGNVDTVWSLIPYHYQDCNPISVPSALLAIGNACTLLERFPYRYDYVSDCREICPGLTEDQFSQHWLECRDMSARFNASAPAEIRQWIYGEVSRNIP